MDIVKLSNGKYVLRKRTLFGRYKYADRDTLVKNEELMWWSRLETRKWWSFPELEELERVIDNYNPNIIKQMAKEKAQQEQDVVIKKNVKFGCKNK